MTDASPPATKLIDLTEPPPIAGAMTFLDHLEELRVRLMWCIGTWLTTTMLTFWKVDVLIRFLQRLAPKTTIFVQLTPGEVFLSSFKLAIFAGIGVALPVVLYHVIRFVSPGLEKRERWGVLVLLFMGLWLFVAGVLFGYVIILPMMLDFLLSYGQAVAHNQLSIASFLDFCTGFLLATGLVFQLPLVLLFLSFMRLVTSRKLLMQWKWALVAAFLLGAIITPSTDPFSQIVMSTALFGLYAFSIALVRAFGK